MKRPIGLLTICFLVFCITSAKIKYASLQIVKIRNNQIISILDSMIDCRKKCPLYAPSNLYFFIQKDSLSPKYTFEVDPSEMVSFLDNSSVCCIYRNHLVIIEKSVPHTFFITTSKTIQVKYYPDIIPSIYEPDCFRYILHDGKFILDFKLCRCDEYK
jgi:hypothetical protein